MSWAIPLVFLAGLILGGALTAWIVLVFTVLAMRTERRQLAERLAEGRRHA